MRAVCGGEGHTTTSLEWDEAKQVRVSVFVLWN